MSNIKQTKDGLIEKSTGRKIESPLDFVKKWIIKAVANDIVNHGTIPRAMIENSKKKGSLSLFREKRSSHSKQGF